MKKSVLIIFLLFSANAYSSGVCYVPKTCEIISSEFSTGGGDSPSWVMEVDCKKEDGLITKYIYWEVSIGGLLGFGRVTAPRKVEFIKHNKDELYCNY